MLLFSLGILACALTFSLVSAQQLSKNLAMDDFHPISDAGTFQAIRRAHSLIGRDSISKNSTTFHKSFDGDVIFS
jgi:hypothetical protein